MKYLYKLKHYYYNKYVLSHFNENRYFISYDYKHKAIWYRNAKVATRTIHNVLKDNSSNGSYIYGAEAGFDSTKFKEFFKFAFVRDPESRLLSGWKDKVVHHNYFNFDSIEHEKMKELSYFLDWIITQEKEQVDKHFRNQHLLIEAEKLDYLGRFENFEENFKHVTKEIGIKNISIPHLNKSKTPSNSINLDERKMIQSIYKKDYELFYPEKLL